MIKIKSILAVGIIALFLGLAVSPCVNAGVGERVIYNVLGERFEVSVSEAKEIDSILQQMTDEIAAASNLVEVMNIIEDYRGGCGRHPFLQFILGLIQRIIGIGNNIDELRPLRSKAFIISWGFGTKLNPLKENKFQLFRPLTLWFYTGRSKFLLNSRTIIIDPCPFSIKSLTGRQFGTMRGFTGIYVHRQNTLTDHSYRLMIGRSDAIRGFDLSFLNPLNQ